jgi:two-component system chemotaxis response regulator CheB
MKKILIIDDSAFMRRILSDIINSDDRCMVVGTANNGKEGLEKIEALNPDVITLDIEMPIMDGLTMLGLLMKKSFKPIILLSSLVKEGADITLKGLDLGAVDFICKPQNIFTINSESIKGEIINKIIMASTIVKPLTLSKPSTSNYKVTAYESYDKKEKQEIKKSSVSIMKKIVAIGISTGGPKALQEVIPYIPSNISAGIVIVQHMPPGFTKSLAERLNSLSEITVKEAQDGDVIKAGVAYIAPGDFHVLVENSTRTNEFCIKLSSDPQVGGHRPSVNVMMNSISKTNAKNVVGVIMTGMGNDGCEGMINLKKHNNAMTIAQDEQSCVVYGMPRAVALAGVVDKVLPLNEIAMEITRMVEEC